MRHGWCWWVAWRVGAAVVGLMLATAGCSGEEGGEPGAGGAGAGGGGGATHGYRFFEDFDAAVGPPFVDGYPALPEALFPPDESRWTQIQDEPAADNELGLEPSRGGQALWCTARGQPEPTASKADLGKTKGFRFGLGDVIRLRADVFADPAVNQAFTANTLLDLEDGDDIYVDGQLAGGGLRIRISDGGRIQLDRGEIIGSDDGVSPPDRLSNLTSDRAAPVGSWFTLEAVIKLGTRVPRSTVGPVDMSFDADETAAWCEIWFTPEGGQRELILRMKGSTFHDRDAAMQFIGSLPDPPAVDWPEVVDFDVFQAGCTNNRSTTDVRLLFDDVLLEQVVD